MTASVPVESNPGAGKRNASFPRSSHLLRHADFERVYKQGRKHFSPSMTVFYLKRPQIAGELRSTGGIRVGFTVGRAFGGAVQRNRLKRRLREAVRLSRPWPQIDVDIVVNPKRVAPRIGFEPLMNEVRQAFVVMEKKLLKPANNGLPGKESGSQS